MASLVYNSCVDDLAHGAIDFALDTFFVMLVPSSYAPDKDADTRRIDVTAEVSGAGYTADGAPTVATVTKDTVNDRVTIAFSQIVWPASTITARAAVIYKRRGGAASADELVAYVDFGSDFSSVGAAFTLTFSTPITIQN